MYGSLLSLFKQAPMDPREMWKLQHPGCDLQRNRLDCLRQLYATPGYLPTYPPTPEIGFWPMLCMCLCTIGFTTLIALVFWDMYGEYVIKGYGMAQAASVSVRSIFPRSKLMSLDRNTAKAIARLNRSHLTNLKMSKLPVNPPALSI